MYKVIREFYDLQDSNHLYKVGDTYTGKRFEELSTDRNRLGTPVIEEVKTKRVKKDAD